jgi:hypothetical protein
MQWINLSVIPRWMVSSSCSTRAAEACTYCFFLVSTGAYEENS